MLSRTHWDVMCSRCLRPYSSKRASMSWMKLGISEGTNVRRRPEATLRRPFQNTVPCASERAARNESRRGQKSEREILCAGMLPRQAKENRNNYCGMMC